MTTIPERYNRNWKGQYCAAIGCSNYRSRCERELSFFRFPKDPERCKRWVVNTRRADFLKKDSEYLNSHKYLCAEHFELSQFMNADQRNRLIWNAVPTLFNVPNPPPKLIKNPARKERALKRSCAREALIAEQKLKKTMLLLSKMATNNQTTKANDGEAASVGSHIKKDKNQRVDNSLDVNSSHASSSQLSSLTEIDTEEHEQAPPVPYHILVGCTGSVASIKIPKLINQLLELKLPKPVEVRVVSTERALHFFNPVEVNAMIYRDADEWSTWSTMTDPVLHIELRRWADVMVIAPLDANTLAKIANGICDNLLSCVARAWDPKKPFLFCPAMNTYMWEHPLTALHVQTLVDFGYKEVPVVKKALACGDVGYGAMAEVPSIVAEVVNALLSLPDCS